MDWREEYKRKMVEPEEAVKIVKSGDYVVFGQPDSLALGMALANRADELEGVTIQASGGRDFPWLDRSWQEVYPNSFILEIAYVLPMYRELISEKRGDFAISGLYGIPDASSRRRRADVYMVQLSPPDEHGFCSFGASLWDKKELVKSSKIVLAEVNKNMIRTYGDNFVHVSEIDYFVEHTPTGRIPGTTDILGRRTTGPGEVEKMVGSYIVSLINDGDTLEMGVGGTAEWVALSEDLKNKHDLGWHSENTVRGIATLVKEGVINGKRKTLHPEKAVGTAVGGGTKEEMDFINMNPMFEIYSSEYVLDPRVIAAHDNMVAINSAIAVDLTGQIAAEAVGPVMISGVGGQLAFAIGTYLSKGGRNIIALPSIARGGTVSRIVPMLEPGTIVSVPRTFADIIVTEYGIARLKGKTQQERALELIGIAHPDFRTELKKQAQKLYWP